VKKAHSFSYWKFVQQSFRWATRGVWAILEALAVIIGILFGFFQYVWPNIAEKIPVSTAGLINGVIPALVGALLFIIRF
jgi:hypothetical protein